MPAADLALAMGAAPDPGAVGIQLTYVITVSNEGPDAAEGVTLVDTLPPTVTLGPVSASQGSCSGTSIVTCALGSLPAGSSATVTIGVVPTLEGMVTNSALVAGSTLDLDPLDNQAIRTTTIQAAGVGSADLALAMAVSPDPGAVGAALIYDITVVNAGPDQAENVTVVDALPPSGLTFGAATPSQGSCSGTAPVTCELGVLGGGSTATITIDVVPTIEGQLANSALVASSTLDPDPLNNQAVTTTTVTGSGGCTITGTDGRDVLRGTAGRDVICGLGDADRLVGLRGNDVLKGGEGDDVLRGGGGNDRLVGGAGPDLLKGAGGRDVLKGGPGRDRYSGGSGRDRCVIVRKERARGCE